MIFLSSVFKVLSVFTDMVGLGRFELPTSRLSGVRSNLLSYGPPFMLSSSIGGDERNRTADPLLARQVLSQLSYTPIFTKVQALPRSLHVKSLLFQSLQN